MYHYPKDVYPLTQVGRDTRFVFTSFLPTPKHKVKITTELVEQPFSVASFGFYMYPFLQLCDVSKTRNEKDKKKKKKRRASRRRKLARPARPDHAAESLEGGPKATEALPLVSTSPTGHVGRGWGGAGSRR